MVVFKSSIKKSQLLRMAKHYTKEVSNKQLEKEIQAAMNVAEPSKESIDFILNFSKSLSVKKSEKVGTIFLNLN